ncbi:MAG TPA: type II toxin-antitoxin system HipA family toxin [Gammaproteobacteria bacterium]|nr:type II toxin-antitoxin system HipA family toxin [Gammaproteobacteria bacterium]
MNGEVLHIWHRDRLVGRLTDREVGSGFEFAYDPTWVADGFRLSASLPLQVNAFGPDVPGTHFFGNLVPEGNQRDRWVRELRVADTDFSLLKALGRDCAGAFSILPADVAPSFDGDYVPLSDAELAGYCLRKGKPAADERAPVRFSLAGVQEKLPVHGIDGKFYCPQGAFASSLILKFEVPDYTNVPLYEAFLAELYRRAGIETCGTRYREDSAAPYLVVKRFDRYKSGERVERLHQEDFCQALGLGRSQKYEAENGPSFADCVLLLRKESSLPVADINRLTKWLVLNVLAGNSDGHSKNLALLQVQGNPNQWRLAPFYDIVCTGAIERLETKAAFSIGGQSFPDDLTRTHWDQETTKCGLGRGTLADLAGGLAAKLPGIAKELRAEFEESHHHAAALQRVAAVVDQRCRRVLQGL